MNRRTSAAALISTVMLVVGCGSAAAQPQTAHRAYEGPWQPVAVPEPTLTPSVAPRSSWALTASPAPRSNPEPAAKAAPKATPRPTAKPRLMTPKLGVHAISGISTWYKYVPGGAAAGPALRAALGSGWRGRKVSVCVTGGNCISVTLSDWCACGSGRVIDLDRASFAALADPSRGILAVTVHW